MLSDEVKTGQVDHKLWIAIEDIHDGWEQSGTVGQEVYGAGVCFGIIPRHYYDVPNEDFIIFLDYPTAEFKYRKNKSLSFEVNGDERLNCRMLILNQGKEKPTRFTVKANEGDLKGKHLKNGDWEFTVYGKQKIEMSWSS